MIRVVYVLRRRSGMSLDEFYKYWFNNHGPLVASHATHMAIKRYIQVHTMDTPANRAMKEFRGLAEPYDGVAELWWENLEILMERAATSEYQQAQQELLGDEKQFIDFSRSSMWMGIDLPQVNPVPENIVASKNSPLVKLYYIFHRLPNLSRDEAQLYWRMNHGPFIRSHAAEAGIKRYIQVHTMFDDMIEQARINRGGMEDIYDGHAELWYDQFELAGRFETPQYQLINKLAKEDECKFIDFSRSAMWMGKEHVIIDR